MQTHLQMPIYKLAFNTAKGTYFFSTEEIVRLEAVSNYTNIYFVNHRPIMAAKVLKDYEELLSPYGFVRTHRSHLVNKKHIMCIDTTGNVIMQDTSKAEVSRRKKPKLMQALKN